MPTYNYPFAGGVDAVAGYGDRYNFLFGGTWALRNPPENWTVAVTSSSGDFTIGTGVLHDLNPTICMTFKNRVYLGLGSQFNFSDNDDPTGWEEQNPGAGFQDFLNQYGGQDAIVGLSVSQGRLVVSGRRSVQIWQTDADPGQFSLIQTLDNVGSIAPLAVQQLGDFDVLILDDTGVRSLRTREVTLNAYVDDVGSPIDDRIQAAILTSFVGAQAACSTVEPKTKNYWLYLNGTIYVFSRHPAGKIAAWSTYQPKGSDGMVFEPVKFEVFNGLVYCRATNQGQYVYGGGDGATYDSNSPVSFTLPYLDDKRPGTNKNFTAIGAVISGNWSVRFSADPHSNTYTEFMNLGSATNPNALTDSSYDVGRIPVGLYGTHFSVQAVSGTVDISTTAPPIFGSLIIFYDPAEIQ